MAQEVDFGAYERRAPSPRQSAIGSDVDFAAYDRRAPGPPEAMDPTGGVDFAAYDQRGPGVHQDPYRSVIDEFGRGVNQGVQSFQSGLYGFSAMLGQMAGSETLTEFGLSGAVRNMEEAALHASEVSSLSDIESASDFVRFALNGIGQSLPSIATSIGSGGLGAAVARAAFRREIRQLTIEAAVNELGREGFENLSRSQLNRAVRNYLRDPTVNRMMVNAARQGTAAGVMAPSVVAETGHNVLALNERGLVGPGAALATGVLGGALDALPTLRLIDRMFPGVDREVSKSFIRDFAASTGRQALLEGGTEAAQEVVAMAGLAYHDPTFNPFDDAGIMRTLDAAAIGALAGVATGAAADVAGGVTRRARDLRNQVATGGGRLSSFIRSRVFRQPPDSTAPAATDNTEELAPGWNAAVDAVYEQATNEIDDALGAMRAEAADAMENVRADIPGANTADVNERIDQAESSMAGDASPELGRVSRRIAEEVAKLREQIRGTPAGERAAAMVAGIQGIMDRVSEYIQDRFGRIAAAASDKTAQKFETQDMDDDDVLAGLAEEMRQGMEHLEEAEAVRLGDAERALTEPKTLIGRHVRRSYSIGHGKSTRPVRSRSRGDSMRPFTSRKAADAAAEEIRQSYRNVPGEAIEVVETEGGFAVAIHDTGKAEEIFEHQRFLDTLTKSAAIGHARDERNPNSRRRLIRIRRPGQTEETLFDMPTLAYGGRDMNERAGVTRPADAASRMTAGFDSIIARMIDMGYEILDAEALDSKELFRGMTLAEARKKFNVFGDFEGTSRIEKLEDAERFLRMTGKQQEKLARSPLIRKMRITAANRLERESGKINDPDEIDKTPVIERGRVREKVPGHQQGAEAAFIEEGIGREVRETGDDKREALGSSSLNPRQRVAAPPRISWTELTKSQSGKARVGIMSKSQSFRDSVASYVNEVAKLVGMADQEFILVDSKGAGALLASKRFDEDEKAMIRKSIKDLEQNKMYGRIMHSMSKKSNGRIIFLSDKALDNMAIFNRVLLHEMGHAVEYVNFSELPSHVRASMWVAFTDESRHPGSSAHTFAAKKGTEAGFHEWMADQFLAAALRDPDISSAAQGFANSVLGAKAPKSNLDAVVAYFKKVAGAFKKLWQKLRDQFKLNDSYAAFLRGVKDAARQSEPGSTNAWGRAIMSANFKNQGKATNAGKLIVEEQNLELRPAGVSQSAWAQIKQRLNNTYPNQMQYAGMMWRSMQRINDQWFSSLNSMLRRMDLAAATKLADIMNKTPGENLTSPLYFDEKQRRTAEFNHKSGTILGRLSEADRAAAHTELKALNGRAGLHKHPGALAIRDLMDQLHAYMISKGLPVKQVLNYFPKIWDPEKIRQNVATLRVLLEAKGVNPTDLDKVIANMMDLDATVMNNAIIPAGGFMQKRAKLFDDPAFDQFLSDNLEMTLTNYINGVVKRAEFNAVLGEDSRVLNLDDKGNQKPWNPRGKLDELLDEARLQGATQEQLQNMMHAVEAMLGRYGANTPDGARRAMAWVATYQNVRILGFSQLASLPDIVGPAIRSGEYSQAFKVLQRDMKSITDKTSDLNETARVWGIISDTMNQHVLTEHMDTHWYPPMAKKINNNFFRYTGMERLNNFVRAYALAVGLDFIERRAEAASTGDQAAAKDLQELGLTHEIVASWIADGRKTFGAEGYVPVSQGRHDEMVAQAMVRFVNEANMRPNPSQRPLMSSHPALMLIWHLKAFMFAFYDVFIRQIMANAAKANLPWEKALVIALPATLIMAMTAAGLELRELIQYKIFGSAGRTDRMDGAEYLWDITQRSGLFGPSQLLIDWEEADNRGNSGLIAIAGPALTQLNSLLNEPTSTTIPEAIPGVNNLPELKKKLQGVLQ